MTVGTTLRAWSATAANNSPKGTDVIGTSADDELRQIQATVRQYLASESSTVVPSAGVADLTTATGHRVPISGSATITGLGSEDNGIEYVLSFTGAPILVHSTAMQLPGQATINADTGMMCVAECLGSNTWKLWGITRASGAPTTMSPQSTVLASTVALSSTASYFDGPSIAQGTSGTWLVTGQVTVTDPSSANIQAKLWDGTTVIASGQGVVANAGNFVIISLSGYIINPAGNLRISVKDTSNATGKILADTTGNGKDSSITAIRIA